MGSMNVVRGIRRLAPCAAVAVLTLAVSAPVSAAPSRRSSVRTDAALQRAVKRLRTAISRAPRRSLSSSARRRELARVARAGVDLRHRRYCPALLRISLVKRVGGVAVAARRAEDAFARSGRARRCQGRTRAVRVAATATAGGGFPAAPPPDPGEDNEQGEELPPRPHGAFRPGARKGAPSGNDGDGGEAGPRSSRGGTLGNPFARAAGVDDPVDAFVRTDLGDSAWGGQVQDPSEASAGNVVLVSVNRRVGYSTNGGATFTYIDPTTIFPTNPDGGICCDQVLHYDKQVDRFFWLIQYGCNPGCDAAGATSENRYRLALASPAQVASSGATAWKYFDFTSRTFDAARQWMDYPDMAIGSSSLYFTFDFPRSGSAAWARIRVADLVNLTSIGFRYYKKSGDYVLKTVQGTGTRGWIARRKDDSNFELTHWDDGSTYVYHHTVGFPTPPTQRCAETDPDGIDMLAMFGCAGFSQSIGGAAQRSNGDIWLAWTAGRRIRGASTDLFPHAHIQLLAIDSSTLGVVRNRAIWNENYSWSYPALSASEGGEVAMTYFTGGGTAGYFNWGVGFVTNREYFRRVATGAKGRARIGDYLTVRPARPSSRRFSASGYVLDASGRFHPWWALFGRSSDRPITILPPIVIQPPAAPPPPAPPPPPPPPAPAATALTIACPAAPVSFANNQGTPFTVTGRLTPTLPGATITVTYTEPQLGGPARTVVHTATTNADGAYTDSDAAFRESQGTWSVRARYGGDATHAPSDAGPCTQTVGP